MIPMKNLSVFINDKKFEIIQESHSHFSIGSLAYEAEFHSNNHTIDLLSVGKKQYDVYCENISETEYDVWIKHHVIRVKVEDSRTQLMNRFKKDVQLKSDNITIKAPMPGLVLAIETKLGDIISPGKGLVILEAMKMENEIKSPIHGKIKSINVSEKMSVEKNQTLIIIEPIE